MSINSKVFKTDHVCFLCDDCDDLYSWRSSRNNMKLEFGIPSSCFLVFAFSCYAYHWLAAGVMTVGTMVDTNMQSRWN